MNRVIPRANRIESLLRNLGKAGCTIRSNMGLLLLECHKNTHKFCSGDGISRPVAVGFDVQLQVLGGWTSVPS
eukprot:1047283-Pelagomonas_calceolata.AAC.1